MQPACARGDTGSLPTGIAHFAPEWRRASSLTRPPYGTRRTRVPGRKGGVPRRWAPAGAHSRRPLSCPQSPPRKRPLPAALQGLPYSAGQAAWAHPAEDGSGSSPAPPRRHPACESPRDGRPPAGRRPRTDCRVTRLGRCRQGARARTRPTRQSRSGLSPSRPSRRGSPGDRPRASR